jgi:chaperonin GroES
MPTQLLVGPNAPSGKKTIVCPSAPEIDGAYPQAADPSRDTRGLPYDLTVRHQLRPLFDRVVIKELDPDRVRRSGLVVPPGTDEPPPQHGIVLAVGPGLDWWDHVGVQMPVRPGDHVVFPASAGAWVEVDEERLLVCRVGELLGVLENVDECPACGGRVLGVAEACPVCGREGSIAPDSSS